MSLKNESTYIIAEIGSNYDGDLERAKKLITLAKQSGADAAKFQSFQVGSLINHLSKTDGGWGKHPAWEILEKLSLPKQWHFTLQEHAKEVGIDFISTPFDLENLELLAKLNVPTIKIASGDLTYLELLEAAAKTGKPIILSTGHAHMDEVKQAVNCIQSHGGDELTLLHCVSLYPSQIKDANLRAMVTLRDTFNLPVGLSDHSPGSVVPLGAVALGAKVIEKHFTDDPLRVGPDHAFALDPETFSSLVIDVRMLENALGSSEKVPLIKESDERIMARRALYAKLPIPKGAKLTREMINVVRHAYPEGIPADKLKETLGKISSVEIQPNQLITSKMLEGDR